MADPTHAPGALLVTVHRQKCSGYGICADLCPSVFKLDAGGFAYVEGPVPAEMEDEVREVAYECPEEAIVVETVAAQSQSKDGREGGANAAR